MKASLVGLGCSVVLVASAEAAIEREDRMISGWTVHVNRQLMDADQAALDRALSLLQAQLEQIVRVVPKVAVIELQKVPLWFSTEYAQTPPRAEYHPGAEWLRKHGRDPIMAKGVEFTNVRIFEAETRRMPNFALHELAHAYHDRVLGTDQADIKAAYQAAKVSGKYDRVERKDAEGRARMDRAYAMTNEREYFAESSEAFFARNDFFPFDRADLEKHDPGIFGVLQRVWRTDAKR